MDFLKLFLVDRLSYFHLVFGDWALAIIVLALAVRLILLPLQIFNFVQQKRLGFIQPEIDRLAEEYKSDPLLAFRKVAALKKRNGIRTWTSLILSFAQIPIFLGMYQAISSARDFAGAAFLWISSLASPDVLYLLPLIVAVTTYLQFKQKGASGITSPPSAVKMGKLLPVINFLFMATLPSSLVLYYATSGVFQVATDALLKNMTT